MISTVRRVRIELLHEIFQTFISLCIQFLCLNLKSLHSNEVLHKGLSQGIMNHIVFLQSS